MLMRKGGTLWDSLRSAEAPGYTGLEGKSWGSGAQQLPCCTANVRMWPLSKTLFPKLVPFRCVGLQCPSSPSQYANNGSCNLSFLNNTGLVSADPQNSLYSLQSFEACLDKLLRI